MAEEENENETKIKKVSKYRRIYGLTIFDLKIYD